MFWDFFLDVPSRKQCASPGVNYIWQMTGFCTLLKFFSDCVRILELKLPTVHYPWKFTFCLSRCLGAYTILCKYNCNIFMSIYFLLCCFVIPIHRLIWKIIFIEIFEFYFIDGLGRWSRIILAVSGSPSKTELALAIITINWPLSLLQMCLHPEYGILVEFWDPSHCSVTPSLSSFSPKLVIEDPLFVGINNNDYFFHWNFGNVRGSI